MNLVSICMLMSLAAGQGPEAGKYFTITVVDEATGRGVPLVELKTTNNIRYYTDSNGIVAFHEPGLMDQDVFFNVKSHGYEFPKDGFGIRRQGARSARRAAAPSSRSSASTSPSGSTASPAGASIATACSPARPCRIDAAACSTGWSSARTAC